MSFVVFYATTKAIYIMNIGPTLFLSCIRRRPLVKSQRSLKLRITFLRFFELPLQKNVKYVFSNYARQLSRVCVGGVFGNKT